MSPEELVDLLVDLARVPSAVPLGEDTLIEPDDPILVHYVQDELRPRFVAAGAHDIVDLPKNQFAARFGSGDGPCLVLMAYTPTQHHNLMHDPWSGRVASAPGTSDPAVYGQGVTQNKAHQACMVALASWLSQEDHDIEGTLWLCVNNEGRSSHECSDAILDNLPGDDPSLVVQLFNTDFGISVGNRGRVDLAVHVSGQATHSAAPPATGRVIDTVGDVIAAVGELDTSLTERQHPDLGGERAVVYQVSFDPIAPHTLPGTAKLIVDRRYVPPTEPAGAVEQLRHALAGLESTGCQIRVEQGATMLPALQTAQQLAPVRPLEEAVSSVLGREAERLIYGGAFDAGGPVARGIATVMFGVPDEGDLLGDDYVRTSDLVTEFTVLQQTTRNFFAM